jgi:hypothetical protein
MMFTTSQPNDVSLPFLSPSPFPLPQVGSQHPKVSADHASEAEGVKEATSAVVLGGCCSRSYKAARCLGEVLTSNSG